MEVVLVVLLLGLAFAAQQWLSGRELKRLLDLFQRLADRTGGEVLGPDPLWMRIAGLRLDLRGSPFLVFQKRFGAGRTLTYQVQMRLELGGRPTHGVRFGLLPREREPGDLAGTEPLSGWSEIACDDPALAAFKVWGTDAPRARAVLAGDPARRALAVLWKKAEKGELALVLDRRVLVIELRHEIADAEDLEELLGAGRSLAEAVLDQLEP